MWLAIGEVYLSGALRTLLWWLRGAHVDVHAMRTSHDAWLVALRSLEAGGAATVTPCPIRAWGGKTDVVSGLIELREGLQRLEMIDISDQQDVARFARIWPEQGSQLDALVMAPDEGRPALLLESGRHGLAGPPGRGPSEDRVDRARCAEWLRFTRGRPSPYL
jgi:hypothetical protein